MNNHDFIIAPTDTDSISFGKPDGSPFSKEEIKILVKEINDISPEFMTFEDDGYYQTCICVRAKNYVLWDGKKLTIKGSSLKATGKALALREFIQRIIQSIIDEKFNYLELYNEYVNEIMNITDISRWQIKKTVTEKVLNGTRTNETKVMAAIADSEDEIAEGEKIYVYYKSDDTLALAEKFDGNYNQERLLKNLHDTAKCFSTIIDKKTFVNYSLVKSQNALLELTGKQLTYVI